MARKSTLFVLALALFAFVQGAWAISGRWTDAGNYAASFSQADDVNKVVTITSEAELARLAYISNSDGYGGDADWTYKLGRDLDMSDHYWTPIASLEGRVFYGAFDGQGHAISGINVSRRDSTRNGLFGAVSGYKDSHLTNAANYGIVNVRLVQASISGGNYTGGLVGSLGVAKVADCIVDASVSGDLLVGGVIGNASTVSPYLAPYIVDYTTTVTGCLYMGSSVEGTMMQRTGAISGASEQVAVTESYYTNKDMTGKRDDDVYAVKVVDVPSVVSLDSKCKRVGSDAYCPTDGSATFTFVASSGYELPSATVNGTPVTTPYNFSNMRYAASCTIAISMSSLSGSGTENDPYLIRNLDDWNLFAGLVAQGATFSGKFVKLGGYFTDENPIRTMVGESEERSFQGTFDGNWDHYSMYVDISSSEDYAAPFRYVKNATIKNIRVQGGSSSVGRYGSILVGRAYGTTRIEKVYVTSGVSVSSSANDNLGGLVGHGGNSTLTLDKVDFRGSLTSGGGDTGGLVGWSDGMTLNISNSAFRGSFSGEGAFHPIAVRDSFKPMGGTVENTYFYTGPNSGMDNAHIAVAAIRVQGSAPADGSYGTAYVYDYTQGANAGTSKGYYYTDAPRGLSIDYDKERGTPGYYYVNMGEGSQQLVLGDGITSFSVYDDGGKLNGRHAGEEPRVLELVASAGNVFDVDVQVEDLDPEKDYFFVGREKVEDEFFSFGDNGIDQSGNTTVKTKTGTWNRNRLAVYLKPDGAANERSGFEVRLGLKAGTGRIETGAITINDDHSEATIDGNYTGTETASIPTEVTVGGVTLDRSFTPGAFSTIVLPFEIAVANVSGAEFYGLSEMTYANGKWTAGASKVTGTLAANTPYLVNPSAATVTFAGSVALKTEKSPVTTSGNWEFRGAYGYVAFGDSSGTILGRAYGFAAQARDGYSVGQFAKAGPGAFIPAMRAYLVYNAGNGSLKNVGGYGMADVLPETIDVKIVDEQGKVSETVVLNPATGAISKDRWFDIQGRMLKGRPAVKGKYLHNGKVEVVK